MKKFLILFFISSISFAQSEIIEKDGKIERIQAFKSKFIEETDLNIWLPKNFSEKKKYRVLYMHDGQMLFDPDTIWKRQAWDVDKVATKLINDNKVKEFIVVGISCINETRYARYFPQKPYESLSKTQLQELQEKEKLLILTQPNSDNYLKFIITELKPFIDSKYPVYKDRKHTFIAGSSMGGLISMYAMCEYPDVFGGAVCMSTHWPGTLSIENNPIPEAFISYMKTHLPDPKKHKIYFDHGDQGIDALYPTLQKKVDEVMREKGFTNKNWLTKYFPGKDHSEKSWNERLDIPLIFLLKN